MLLRRDRIYLYVNIIIEMLLRTECRFVMYFNYYIWSSLQHCQLLLLIYYIVALPLRNVLYKFNIYRIYLFYVLFELLYKLKEL